MNITLSTDCAGSSILDYEQDSSPYIIEGLVHELLSCSTKDLTPEECLFVVEKSGLIAKVNQRWFVDLLLKCGHLEQAQAIFADLAHWRKLGDLAWVGGDLQTAENYYSRPSNPEAQVYRAGPDWDRLIKLSFFQENWEKTLELLCQAPIVSCGLKPGQIVIASAGTSGKPYLKMATIALTKLGRQSWATLQDRIHKDFQISKDEWERLLASMGAIKDLDIKKFQKKLLPRIDVKDPSKEGANPDAGDSPKARAVLAFILDSPKLARQARRLVRAYLTTGRETDLDAFIEIVIKSGVNSICQDFLVQVMDLDFDDSTLPPYERFVTLFSRHPVMNRSFFGDLLHAKFKAAIALSGGDLLTAIFQRISSLNIELGSAKHKKMIESRLNYSKLSTCRDWAEIRLTDWIIQEGAQQINQVVSEWNQSKEILVEDLFTGRKGMAETPRQWDKWLALVDTCHDWLTERWENEIGSSPWVSENLAFKLIQDAFKGLAVERHAQPLWLSPQHFDIFIPKLSLGIEYMGLQHYQPVSVFGGEEGFLRTVERDQKKQEKCKRVGITLVFIRYDENIADRVQQIKMEFG